VGLVVVRGEGSGSGLRSRHVISGRVGVVVVAEVDVVVGRVQRARQISARLGPLDTDGSRAAACVRARLPAHSTNGRQLDSLSNGEEVWRRDLSPTGQAA
jgi:hypothetical protein